MDPLALDLDAIVQIFRAEADENLHDMEEALVRLESSPGDAETLQAIFRAAHTLKGNAAGLGFTRLAKFAHGVEDVLDGLREGRTHLTKERATTLLLSVDALRDLVTASDTSHDDLSPDHAALLDRLAGGDSTAASDASPASPRSSDTPSPQNRTSDARHTSHAGRTLRVSVDTLDRILRLTGELAVARQRVRSLVDAGGQSVDLGAVEDARVSSDRILAGLQEAVMALRMVPLAPTLRQLSRTVRDVATLIDKDVDLEIVDGDVEVDMSVLEHVKDPLLHIIRNAVDHGIEPPATRLSKGKPARGHIRLEARQMAGTLRIEVRDDGAGLNRARIAARARALGYAAPEQLADHDLFRLIMTPGFSTAERVTAVSGRGVGMDVVRRNLEAVGGSIAIHSTEGVGSTMTIVLPLTIALTRGLLISAAGQRFIVPVDAVLECVKLPADARGHRRVVSIRDQPLPCIRLCDLFALDGRRANRENVLVLQHGEHFVGLIVDEILGEAQTMIKPLPRVLGAIRGVSGTALLDDGRIACIVDVDVLIHEALQVA